MNKIKCFIILLIGLLFIPFSVFAEEKKVTLYFFHGDGCPHCAEENKFLDVLQEQYPDLSIVKYEVWYNPENSSFLDKVQNAMEIERLGVPTTIIGDSYFVGYGGSSASKIERAVQYYYEHDYVDQIENIKNGTYEKKEPQEDEDSFEKQEAESDEAMTIEVPALGNVNLKNISLISAAVLIGFIDGFNPCAMWVLLFLISILIGMKDRKRMWILGLSFLITSAFVYMLIMLSWVSLVVRVTTIIWIRNIIALVAIVGGIFNLRSYMRSHDSGCEVVDDKKRKKILKKIRQFTSEKSFFIALVGVMGLAVSVNVVELACSAGLPLVFTELLALNDVSSFMRFVYTLLYILFFLIDDFIVFFIAMFTMKITGISTKYNKYSHLIGGIIMILMGILLIFKPGWLMFQFK